MTKLSVNVNKVATLRNSRGGNLPNVLKVAMDCEAFGADGISRSSQGRTKDISVMPTYTKSDL